MTGYELIAYILKNNYEDKEIFKDGRLIGYISVGEAAEKFNVGVATIKVWIDTDILSSIKLGDEYFIPERSEDPRINRKEVVK